jgi:hypothetical protein
MLIINELSVGVFLHFTILQIYPRYYGIHIILFVGVAEHKSLVYSSLLFPLLLKLVAQKLEKKWNSSTRSSRLELSWMHFLWIMEPFIVLFS